MKKSAIRVASQTRIVSCRGYKSFILQNSEAATRERGGRKIRVAIVCFSLKKAEKVLEERKLGCSGTPREGSGTARDLVTSIPPFLGVGSSFLLGVIAYCLRCDCPYIKAIAQPKGA